jgi:hypothetical protein
LALTPAVALAFTVENKDADGPYSVPKFSLEDQAKQFRKDGAPSSASGLGQTDFSTPLGPGRLNFGVRQGSGTDWSPLRPGFGSSSTFGSSQDYRSHFERVVTPENLR